MKRDPFQRFLGVPRDASAAVLLGLAAGKHDGAAIRHALDRRVAQVRRHPGGQSHDAGEVCRVLEGAAQMLAAASGVAIEPPRPIAPSTPASSSPPVKPTASHGETLRQAPAAQEDAVSPAPGTRPDARTAARSAAPAPPVRPLRPGREPPKPAPPVRPKPPGGGEFVSLTPFDREVLTILIASGGWNATSRARIIAQAARAGVPPRGLLAVLRGLADYSRRGGTHLTPVELAPSAHRLAEASGHVSVAPVHLFRPLPEPSPWRTAAIASACGLLTLVLGAMLVVWALSGSEDAPPPPIVHEVPPAVTPTPMGAAARPAIGVVAEYDRPPRLQGNAVPGRAVEAADAAPGLPGLFEQEVEVRLSIAQEPSDPAEPIFRAFAAHVETAADGWVLADGSTREATLEAIGDALREADMPSVVARLLEELQPSSPRTQEPIGIWRGAWRTGAMAHLLARNDLTPATAESIAAILAVASGADVDALPSSFGEGARSWLARCVPHLVEVVAFDPQAADAWEMWLAAHRACGSGPEREAALVQAIEILLATEIDLARTGPAADLLGRLLDEADFTASAVVRDGVLALFDAGAAIDDHDLWVLTSLLAQYDAAPWFTRTLVMPDAGGPRFRNRVRDQVAAAWPPVGPDPGAADFPVLTVDPAVAGRWLSVRDRADAMPWRTDDEGLLAQLAVASRANLVAALLADGRGGEAERELLGIEKALDDLVAFVSGLDGTDSGRRAGQPVGVDGAWSGAYEEVRRSVEERMQLLRGLRTTAGTDLGPIDAETFVRVVYRGTNEQVRSQARAVLIEMFGAGPVVAMAMLDQFTEAPRSESVSETVRHLTGAVLPAARSSEWPAAARLALARHALALRPMTEARVDALGAELVESLSMRVGLVASRADTTPMTEVVQPPEAMLALAAAWRSRAAGMLVREAQPATLEELARRSAMRRRLAENGVQVLVGAALSALEHAAYVTAAERPSLGPRAEGVLAEAAMRRLEHDHVLEQAVEIERAIGSIWAMRMGLQE